MALIILLCIPFVPLSMGACNHPDLQNSPLCSVRILSHSCNQRSTVCARHRWSFATFIYVKKIRRSIGEGDDDKLCIIYNWSLLACDMPLVRTVLTPVHKIFFFFFYFPYNKFYSKHKWGRYCEYWKYNNNSLPERKPRSIYSGNCHKVG